MRNCFENFVLKGTAGILFLSNRSDNVVHCKWQRVNCDVERTFSQRCVQKPDSTRIDTRDAVHTEGCVSNKDCERSEVPTDLLVFFDNSIVMLILKQINALYC